MSTWARLVVDSTRAAFAHQGDAQRAEFDATAIIDDWSESENRWLIRAAIGHQRGWKIDTDVDYVLAICDRHWPDSEFFIAKAIGWALRDITSFNPKAVRGFLAEHPTRNSVALREADRGLQRAKPA